MQDYEYLPIQGNVIDKIPEMMNVVSHFTKVLWPSIRHQETEEYDLLNFEMGGYHPDTDAILPTKIKKEL